MRLEVQGAIDRDAKDHLGLLETVRRTEQEADPNRPSGKLELRVWRRRCCQTCWCSDADPRRSEDGERPAVLQGSASGAPRHRIVDVAFQGCLAGT